MAWIQVQPKMVLKEEGSSSGKGNERHDQSCQDEQYNFSKQGGLGSIKAYQNYARILEVIELILH